VAIIIPTKNRADLLRVCTTSIITKTKYPDFSIHIIDNNSHEHQTLSLFAELVKIRRPNITIVPYLDTFNFSRMNNGVALAAHAEVLVFLNNDTEVIDGEWLKKLVFLAKLPKVGAVGPVLLYPDGKIQHAGVAIGLRGTADHVMRGLDPDSDGYFGSLAGAREVSAVTGACLAVKSAVFKKLSGFDENYLIHYQDVDLCQRLSAAGYTNLVNPDARLMHHESASRSTYYDLLDRALFVDRWASQVAKPDPYCDPKVEAYNYKLPV
jgi:GT2 family glycosyltransferase